MIHISNIPTLILPQTPHPQTTHLQILLVAAAAPSNPTPPISRSELLLWEGKSCSEKKKNENENASRQKTQPFVPPASTSYPACVKHRTSSALEPTLVLLPKIHPSSLALKKKEKTSWSGVSWKRRTRNLTHLQRHSDPAAHIQRHAPSCQSRSADQSQSA